VAGPKLDGPGTVRLQTLEDALFKLSGVHALVERIAIEQKSGKPIGSLAQNLKRQLVPMQGLLKSQFQLIADVVTGMILIAGRGGPDALKVRSYREGVAQIRTQLEIAIAQVKEKHAVKEKHE
jgi:hypothetical protein